MPDEVMHDARHWREKRHHPRLEAIAARLARGLEYGATGLMFVLLPIGPFVASAIARDTSYARRYRTTVIRGAVHARGMLRDRAISRYLLRRRRNAAAAPKERIVGACTHCGNCCLNRSCLFLEFDDAGRSRCHIYGSRFWGLLNCSRYPESRNDIELYRCESFTAVPAPDAPRHRVIPVWRVDVPATEAEPVER
jgi:hypothetical protein